MTKPDNNKELITLINKYLQGKASPKEALFLEKYYAYFDKEDGILNHLTETEKEVLEKEILTNAEQRTKKAFPVTPLYLRAWFRIAAAIFIIILGSGAYYLFSGRGANEPAISKNHRFLENDVLPGGNKAVLTLGDGSSIVLDSAQIGALAQQGNTKILKLDSGKLAYNTSQQKPAEIIYNTITTPRGGQYQLVLDDGSKVWLNAASSIRFPVAFVGAERKVEISGEAYFEIAHNAAIPFMVTVNHEAEVKVLGTHFNVNAYTDDNYAIRTTLLEGSIAIRSLVSESLTLIKPEQQARLDAQGRITVAETDTDLDVAWKNGWMAFKSADIKTIMRDVNRWYDVDIIYEGNIPYRTFTGEIPRDANLSELLRLLEASKIHFRIEEKKLFVMP